MLLWSRGRCVAYLPLGCVLAACSVYDPELLEPIPGGAGGRPAGSGGMSGGRGGAGGTAGGGRGGSGGGGTGGAPVLCGDGKVALDERCDIAIAEGMPGACPTECPPLVNCVPRMLEESNCMAYCAELQQPCNDDDGCCPEMCNSNNDADCSASCGDGVLQDGETCETNPEAEAPCIEPDECVTTEMCKEAVYFGSADNCNATCTYTDITAIAADDNCCPTGANANTDTDCRPDCGNNVKEGEEQCDGAPGCNAECMQTRTPEQIACIERHASDENPCEVCTCTQCTQQTTACRDTGNTTHNMRCSVVNACANRENCAGDICYCGDFPDPFNCALFANGSCKTEIEMGAGSTDPAVIASQGENASTPTGAARVLGACIRDNCYDECRGGD